jgi:hypothetical protein
MATIPTDRNLMNPMGDLKLAVAIGAIPGWRALRKFGMNDAVVSSSTQEMWPIGTAKIWPTAAGTLSVVSSSTADDVGSTGAESIVVQGLDADYNEISETIAMDGLTPVASTAEFLRINRAFCTTVGSGEVNAGNITISIGGNPQAYIEATEGQTHQTHYTVPAGHTWIIDDYHIAVGRMSGNTDLHVMGMIRLYDETSNNNYQSWRSVTDIYLWNGGKWDNTSGDLVIPEKTDFRQKIVSTVATQANSVIEGYLVDNSVGI